MHFEWDENKRRENLQKHGLDFVEAEVMFASFALVLLDNRDEYGEFRFVRIAEVAGRTLTLVYTEPDERRIRVISLRRAGPFERRAFDEALRDRLGKG